MSAFSVQTFGAHVAPVYEKTEQTCDPFNPLKCTTSCYRVRAFQVYAWYFCHFPYSEQRCARPHLIL